MPKLSAVRKTIAVITRIRMPIWYLLIFAFLCFLVRWLVKNPKFSQLPYSVIKHLEIAVVVRKAKQTVCIHIFVEEYNGNQLIVVLQSVTQ